VLGKLSSALLEFILAKNRLNLSKKEGKGEKSIEEEESSYKEEEAEV